MDDDLLDLCATAQPTPTSGPPLFCVRSTDMWDLVEQLEEEDVEALGERQNSSGGFSVREK